MRFTLIIFILFSVLTSCNKQEYQSKSLDVVKVKSKLHFKEPYTYKTPIPNSEIPSKTEIINSNTHSEIAVVKPKADNFSISKSMGEMETATHSVQKHIKHDLSDEIITDPIPPKVYKPSMVGFTMWAINMALTPIFLIAAWILIWGGGGAGLAAIAALSILMGTTGSLICARSLFFLAKRKKEYIKKGFPLAAVSISLVVNYLMLFAFLYSYVLMAILGMLIFIKIIALIYYIYSK